MSRTTSTAFAIVVNGERQFSVWPTRRKLRPGWAYLGPMGTQGQMQEWLRRRFVDPVQAEGSRGRRAGAAP